MELPGAKEDSVLMEAVFLLRFCTLVEPDMLYTFLYSGTAG